MGLHTSSRFPLLLLPTLLVSLLLDACTENPLDAGPPKIISGASVNVINQTVPPSGGTITIDRPGDSLNGMTIVVPDSAYSDARSFTISYAPITKHEFGADISVLTPLITIENGGGYSDNPMTVTVPVKVPAGHFAMAFMYDDATRTVEALPLVYTDSTQVQFITRNFQHSATAALRKGTTGGTRSSIFISSTDAATLDGTFDSRFKMGEDNFQFVNWGSYIAPKGHCGGQSIAAMWYYSVKKKNGSPDLYGLYDHDGIERTPKIWYDDQAAFRFCSVVQNRQDWSSIKYYGDRNWDRDLATYRAIAFAIRKTGDPQCLYVSNEIKPGDPTASAHAIIAYKTSNGKISVCDPNFPSQEKREIVFDRRLGDFEPYYSGDNARETGTPYFNIHCAVNSSLIDWDEMSALWKKVLDGTIGNDLYPEVRLKVRNSNNDYVPLTDGMKIPSQVTIDVSADGFEPRFRVFEFSTQQMISDNQRDFKLSPGKHRIGIYYKGPNPFPEYEYIGFKWVTVEVQETPEPRTSGPCSCTLNVNGTAVSVTEALFTYADQYPTFLIGVDYVGGYIHVESRGDFTGKGTYPLWATSEYTFGSHMFDENRNYYVPMNGDNSITITEWSDFAVEGRFVFTHNNTSTGVLRTATGTFSCGR